jgi:hypothetical protein
MLPRHSIRRVAAFAKDHGWPTNVKGEAGRKAVDKLIRAGLLEEVRAATKNKVIKLIVLVVPKAPSTRSPTR